MQLRRARDLARDGVLATDLREAGESRVKIAEAALRQAEAKVTFIEREDSRAASGPAGPVVMVPRHAVAMRERGAVVFEVRDGHAWQREVTLGAGPGERAVVMSGLSGGEILVAHPPETLRDGDVVTVKT
jgi:hypothetical protein